MPEHRVRVLRAATGYGEELIGAKVRITPTPFGVAVTPDGSKVYVANTLSASVSVIATATNTVTATIPVGVQPIAFGFLHPAEICWDARG